MKEATEAWTKWCGLVSEQSQSGQSVAAFCSERGLRAWLSAISESAATRPRVEGNEGNFHLIQSRLYVDFIPRTVATEFPFSVRQIPRSDFFFVRSPSQMGNDGLPQLRPGAPWHEM